MGSIPNIAQLMGQYSPNSAVGQMLAGFQNNPAALNNPNALASLQGALQYPAMPDITTQLQGVGQATYPYNAPAQPGQSYTLNGAGSPGLLVGAPAGSAGAAAIPATKLSAPTTGAAPPPVAAPGSVASPTQTGVGSMMQGSSAGAYVPPGSQTYTFNQTGSTAPSTVNQNGLGTLPGGGGGMGIPTGPNATSQPGQDQLMQMINAQGNPISQTPAWQAMVGAQQRNIQENATNLAEQFNVGGGRFGSSFGTAMTDYYNQAGLNQNALLGQMTATAGENAMNRYMGAQQQLSGQDFQSQMDQYNIAAQMAQQQYGAQNQAAMGMYGGQMSALSPMLNYNQGMQSLGMQGALGLGGLTNQSLGLGGQLGQMQYGQQQQAINNLYQQYMTTLPQNNPLLQMMYGAATYYPSMFSPGYNPGMLGSMMQGAGSMLGGAAALAPFLCWVAEAVYGTNDLRVHLIRRWLRGPFSRTKIGRVVVAMYVKFGQRVAGQVRKHSLLKHLLKPVFDLALRQARRA